MHTLPAPGLRAQERFPVGRGSEEGTEGLLQQGVLSREESGAWREEEDVGRLQIRSDRASKERLFLGPALEAQRGLETLKMLLYSECGYLAAAKSLFVHQVHGLIQNEKPTQGDQI